MVDSTDIPGMLSDVGMPKPAAPWAQRHAARHCVENARSHDEAKVFLSMLGLEGS